MTEERKNDEIDLIEVFQKIGTGIKNAYTWFLDILYKILLFFIRRAFLIGATLIIILAFGYYKYKSSPRYYSSTLEAHSNAMASLDMINYLNNINELFVEDNLDALKSKLDMNEQELDKIKGAKAYKVIDLNKDGLTDIIDFDEKYASSDSVVSRSRFVIKVEVFDETVFPVIQTSILNYIDQNKYINELNGIRKRQLNDLISKLDDEISSLDSLKKYEYFKKENDQLKTQSGQLLVMNEKETQLYHTQIISLYKEQQNLEQQLELRTDPITIIQDFSSLSVVENNLMFYLKKYFIIGLVLAVLISILVENWKGIRKVIADSKKK